MSSCVCVGGGGGVVLAVEAICFFAFRLQCFDPIDNVVNLICKRVHVEV